MAYNLPIFNVPCRVRTPASSYGPNRTFDTVCQVKGVPRSYTLWEAGASFLLASFTIIKLPPRTYVTAQVDAGGVSTIEVLDGSGTIFTVRYVWDVAYGFENEFRACMVLRQNPLRYDIPPP